MHDIDDFILPITTRSHSRTLLQTNNEPDIMDNIEDSKPSEDTDNDEGTMPLPLEPTTDDASDPPL